MLFNDKNLGDYAHFSSFSFRVSAFLRAESNSSEIIENYMYYYWNDKSNYICFLCYANNKRLYILLYVVTKKIFFRYCFNDVSYSLTYFQQEQTT